MVLLCFGDGGRGYLFRNFETDWKTIRLRQIRRHTLLLFELTGAPHRALTLTNFALQGPEAYHAPAIQFGASKFLGSLDLRPALKPSALL
jgi:hypothetical protein